MRSPETRFRASLALVLIALFFASRLYRLNLMTIGDFFRERYDRRVEVGLSLAIVVGYLGWTAAQISALGLVFNVVSEGAVAVDEGVVCGALIGGVLYFLLALIPMSLAYTALLVDPAGFERHLGSDSQLVLPRLVLDHMPLGAQVVFFGALLSAILSSASGALLAPSVAFTENVLRPLSRRLRDRELLWATRMTLACFTLIVVAVALNTHASIYELVERAYQITVVAAFVPLTAGLYWRRATTAGAIIAGAIGTLVWIACEVFMPDALLPPAIAGLVASAGGMLVGSLAGGLPAVRR